MATTAEAILLVDDDAAVRRVLALILKREGYRVLEAGSGQEALHLYVQHAEAIRLLVTDMEMPKMRGPELAVELTKLGCSAPVLYISAYHAEESLSEFAIHFLQKPVRPGVLIDTVKRILGAGSGSEVRKKPSGAATEARPGSSADSAGGARRDS